MFDKRDERLRQTPSEPGEQLSKPRKKVSPDEFFRNMNLTVHKV